MPMTHFVKCETQVWVVRKPGTHHLLDQHDVIELFKELCRPTCAESVTDLVLLLHVLPLDIVF